jgi:Zn-dependent peptidase ImmA (M78 family)
MVTVTATPRARLATRFDVSIQAMRYRLVTLGILEPD